MPRSTRRRHCMHQHLPLLSSFPFAPVYLQAFLTVDSFPPPLVPPAVNPAAPPPRPRPLEPALSRWSAVVADCLARTQLSSGLLITPATISSPAAIPAFQRLVWTPDVQLATLLSKL